MQHRELTIHHTRVRGGWAPALPQSRGWAVTRRVTRRREARGWLRSLVRTPQAPKKKKQLFVRWNMKKTNQSTISQIIETHFTNCRNQIRWVWWGEFEGCRGGCCRFWRPNQEKIYSHVRWVQCKNIQCITCYIYSHICNIHCLLHAPKTRQEW